MGFLDEYNKALEEEKKKKKKSTGDFMDTYRDTLATMDREETAPITTRATKEKKDERKWFDGGAFDDGYQFGDILKTTTGTIKDIRENLIAGVLGIGEATVDAGAYLAGGVGKLLGADKFADKTKDFISKELVNEEKVAKAIVRGTTSPLLDPTRKYDTDDISILGEKSDSLVQSGGQLLGTMGLQAVGVPWFVTSGVTSFGSEAENAFNQGAGYGEAGLSAAVSAGAEILTEKLFGGSGLGEKGLVNLDGLTKGISNKLVKVLADHGVDMAAEGFEEVFSQVASNLGTSLYKEENLGELLLSEEALDSYLESFVGGAALGGVANVGKVTNSIQTGQDYRTGMTENEQKVFDKVYADAIAEAEQDGKKLTKNEKAKIYDEVVEQMEKGYISTDTIEEVLGGDTYKSYRDTVDSEDSILKEFEELGKKQNATLAEQARYNELSQQVKEIRENSKRNEFKAKLGEEVSSLVQNERLGESYAERSRRGQAFAADLSKYDKKQQQTIQKAIDSGILNNTNRTHEFVDVIAKISADKGVSFDFTNNQKLKESGFAVDGKQVNGFVTKDGVTLNIDSPKAWQSTVGHEITHVLEGTEMYDALKNTIFEYAKSKGEYDTRLAQLTETYKGVDADVEAELTADLVGDYLFQDSDFVSHLSTANRNVFQKIFDEIKYLCKIATGSKEARELEKVKRAFEKAYRAEGKAKGDTKYSLSDSDGKQLTKEQQEFFKDSKMRDENGNLKVMYHGSQDAGFHVFDAKMSDDNTSFFFVDRNDVAASYSGTTETYEAKTIRSAEDMNNFLAEIGQDEDYSVTEQDGQFILLYDGERVAASDSAPGIYKEFCWYEGVGEGDANYKVYLNLTNPLEVDVEGRNWNNISREYSQEVYDRYKSLTDSEKTALAEIADWGEYGIFKDEILSMARAKANGKYHDTDLASAYEKLGGANANLYDAFSIAQDNFSEESLKEFAVKQMNTRDYAAKAKAEGYDGVIFKNIVDIGGYGGEYTPSTVAIAFDSNQIKSVANEKPTGDKDIRYSLGEVTDAQNEQGLDRKSEVQYSLSRDAEFSDKAIAKNSAMLHVDAQRMEEAKALRSRIAGRMNEIKDRGLVGLPEDIEGNTYIANSSYDGTEENTTICPRSLASEAFVDAVSEYLGRPLSIEEQIYISQDLQGRSLTPECTYCYVATDRKAYRAFLGDYVAQRDAVLQKVQADPNADVSRSGELYKEFLSGRKDTNPMYSRFKMWVDAYKTGKPMIDASHLANINKLMGDINSGFGAELKPQIVDAMKYAQSASWAKKRVNYVAYNGHILNWKQDRINKLNSHYGLRMYSFSDFHPAFVLENMQMITDASVRGLKMLGYTKDTDFVEIFAPSGMNINVSTFGFEVGGNVYENNLIGAEWEKAKALREQHPNVGITFVATNDTLVNWSLDQDWIDVVIPYHLVRTGAEVAKAFGYTNYTGESSDTKTKDWKKGDNKSIAPTEHNNDLETYFKALEKNHLNPRFERFKNHPNYMKLVNECRQSASESKPVQPVFNEDAAMKALAKLEANGYYQPIGGSVDRMYEIAAEVAEDMAQELAPAMSLSEMGEQTKRYGNFATPAKDLRLAPVAEETTVSEATVAENATVAPVAVAENATTTEDLFPAITPIESEIEQMQAEMDTLTEWFNQNGYTSETAKEYQRKTERYLDLEAKLKELEQQQKAADDERLGTLSDADVPPEKEAPYYAPQEKAAAPDPFKDRDMHEVGNRKVKAYMYENPEVKPYFQAAANAMLGDLNNGVKGEKWYNDELYYESGGEKGWMGVKRHTTDDIAALLDQWGYTYAEIEKGLNAIIEDNGAENNAVSKRIEFMLDDRLRNGYTDVWGEPIPADQGYIELLREKQITEYSKEAFDALMANADQYAPVADEVISKKETTTPLAKATPDTMDAPIYESKEKDAVKGQTTMFEPPKPNPRVANVLTEETEIAKKKSGIGSKLVSALVDKGMVFENLSLETGNMRLQSKYNYALPSNTEARAQYLMENGDKGVKSLKDIKARVEKSGKTDQFYDYLYHVHNIDRMTLADRFMDTPNKPVFGETVTAAESKKKVAQYEKTNPEFKALAEDVYAYNRHLRKMLADSGVISRKTAALWQKMYPHYVPIRRVDTQGQNISVPLDSKKTGVNNPVKRATGGSSDIMPLFETMAQRTEQTFRAIARNSFGIELKNTLGTTIGTQETNVDEVIDTIGAQEELLKPGTTTTQPTFTVFENGEKVEFEITEDMFNALKPADGILGYRNKVVQKVGDARRNLLTVWNPVFALYRNPIKDIQDVAVNSQHPLKTYLNVPNAIFQMATNGEYATEYHKNGGKSNTYFDSRTNKFKAEDNLFKKIIGMPVRAVENAGEFIEEIPRLAEYIASRQEGRSVERSMLDAARVTTNFAAGGDFTKFLNSHGFTFLNASVQGASQHVRNFREAKQQGLKGYVKVLVKYAVAGLPTILLNSLLWDDDEEYAELSDYVKQNYYVVAKTEDGKFVRIPKGRTSAVIGELMNQMENLVTGDDEVDFSTFFELFMNNIAPNNPIENNILAPILQVKNNEAWYGGDLVPSRLQDLPSEEQYDESTDSISKWLGEKTGTSPYKWNYLIDQYSGGLGDVFLPMLTPEAESGDNSLVGNILAPWKKEVTTDKVLNNKYPGDFYDLKDELEKKSNSSKATEEDTMRSMFMQSVSWDMSDLYKQKREIQNSDLSDAEKYEAVREIQEQINALAESGLNGYNDVSIMGKYSEVGDRRYNYDEENGKWYEIQETNSDGTANFYYEKEQEVTKALGITYEQYWNNREEYNYAYDKPEQYQLARAVGGYESYRGYTSALWDIKADKDASGKSISGSRKEKVIDYLNNLNIDYYHKIILFKNEYNADDTYNAEIVEYLNGRDDISYDQMVTILKYLGFEISEDGTKVYW